jgi:hypothetical protein
MDTPGRTPTSEERRDVTPGSRVVSDVRDEFSVRNYVLKKSVNEAAYVRLRSELAAARPEFELLVERTGADGESWAVYGRELLEMAETTLRRGGLEEAWRYLHAARRFEVYGLERLAASGDSDGERSELDVRAALVCGEALDNLDGWRRRAVVNLLCDETETVREDVTGAELRAASRILHEQYERVYLVRSERQRQFNQLALMGTLSGLSLFVLTLVDSLWDDAGGLPGLLASVLETPFGSETVLTAPGFAVFMTITGVMGASLFGMRSLRKQSLSTKIPQQINQLTVTSARGVVGAISALLFYFVLQTPLLQDNAILAEGAITAPLMVVVAFAAGYTERMAPTAVAKVASITTSSERDSSTPDPAER